MLSRQIIEVKLPPKLPVIQDSRVRVVYPHDYQGYIDLHLATPYGVSGHLLIPAVKQGSCAESDCSCQPTLSDANSIFELDVAFDDKTKVFVSGEAGSAPIAPGQGSSAE